MISLHQTSRQTFAAQKQITPAALSYAPETWMRSFAQTVAASILPRAHVDPDVWASSNIIFSSPKDPIQGPLDFSLSRS